MTNYDMSPKMIGGRVYCNTIQDANKLKSMDIDRRWREDNRVPTWTFGVYNFGFDQKFIYNGMIINDTDDRVQKILGNDAQNNIYNDIIGTRNIKNNGNWLLKKND